MPPTNGKIGQGGGALIPELEQDLERGVVLGQKWSSRIFSPHRAP